MGSEISNFFGVPRVRITGILEPTNTFLDSVDIMSTATLNSLKLREDLVITQSPLGELSYYYLYDADNIPSQFSSLINPKKLSFYIDGKTYLPIYIGYTDAQEMLEAKEFS